MVRMTGCHLIALRAPTLEWEVFEASERAESVFPFSEESKAKHQVSTDALSVLAASWQRMYAWVLEDPIKFSEPVPVQIKKGVQKIQSMDADLWAIAWQSFCQQEPDKPLPAAATQAPGSLTLFGMPVKDAFHMLEGDANILLKGYKPDIDLPSLIHVAVMNGGTAFIVGSFMLCSVRKFNNKAQFKKIQQEGDKIWRHLMARQVEQLEGGESKSMYAWVIENKEVFHPPMAWKTEP